MVITSVYVTMRTSHAFPREVFLAVPGVTPEMLEAFDASLMQKEAGKQQRDMVRKLLSGITGVHVGQTHKSGVRILALPEKLFLARTVAPTAPSELDDFNLCALFGSETP